MPRHPELNQGLDKTVENGSENRDVPPHTPNPGIVVTVVVPGAWSWEVVGDGAGGAGASPVPPPSSQLKSIAWDLYSKRCAG